MEFVMFRHIFVFNSLLVFCATQRFENVARNKTCSISSYQNINQSVPSNAVNGDKSGTYPGNCIHTAPKDTTAWWEVNLGRPYPVRNITIWPRTGYEHRMIGTIITVDGKECFRVQNVSAKHEINITCLQGVVTGTVLRVSKNSSTIHEDGNNTINICEFEVFSCGTLYWGLDCGKLCGNCSDNSTCDKITGHCPSCALGWKPPFCVQVAEAYQTNMTMTWIIVGSVLGAVLVLVLIITVVILRCRQNRRRSLMKEESSLDNSTELVNNPVYQSVNDTLEDDRGPKNTTKDQPTSGSIPLDKTVNQHLAGYENTGLDEYDFSPSLQSAEAEEEVDALEGQSDVTPQRDDKYYTDSTYMTSEGASLKLDTVQQYLLDKLRSDVLAADFKALPAGLKKAHDSGSKDVNSSKNRFPSILPYEDTRVVLRGVPDSGSNDYINASYIKGYRSNTQYIAAQGPKENTMGDFWKMVWQEHVTHIVMLTRTVEGKRIKCEEYWPATGMKKRYAAVDVTGLLVRKSTDYIRRTFDISIENQAIRHVSQYQYTSWSDHDAPSTTALVNFWRTVKASHHSQQSSPLLVHCSAGVGRTGIFIALDILMEQLEEQNQIDVFGVVNNMRKDRCNMIISKLQYCVLHETVLEAYTSQGCKLSLTKFDSVFKDPVNPHHSNNRIDAEFQKLKQMKVLMRKPKHAEAMKKENIKKNRSLGVLPDDNHLVRLTIPVAYRNDYINAVRIQSADQPEGYLLTQLPLPDTIVDFWRLVAGNDVRLIVSLLTDMQKVKKKNHYWPLEQGQTVTVGPFSIRLQSVAFLGQHAKRYTISLVSSDDLQSRKVELFHYWDWRDKLPGNIEELVQLADSVLVHRSTVDLSNSPVLMQCNDGASKSGLFCAICDSLGRMKSGEVDVYTSVRLIQTARPECITSQAQYRFLFRVAQEYKAKKDVLSNL